MRSRHLIPLLALGACVMHRTEPRPLDIEVPARWSQTTDSGTVHRAWWRDLGGPALGDLIDEALGGNRNLRVVAESIALARAQARIAGADAWPQASARFSGQRQKQVFVGFPIPGAGGKPFDLTFTSYGVSLDVSWEIDLWGRVRAARSAAEADLAAATLDYEAARLSLAAQVSKAWFAQSEARAQLALARRTVASYRRALEITEARFRAGRRSTLDVNLAEVALAQSENAMQQREQLLDRTKRQLEILLGRYPKAAIASASLPAVADSPVPAGLPAEIIGRRPDLRAARNRLVAALARVGEANASLYPRISLTGSTGTIGNELDNLLDGNFSVWSLLGNVVQPIFQGGRLRANVRAQEARERQAFERFANAVLVAFSEVEGALAAERFLAAQRKTVARLVERTAATQRTADERYRSGRTGILELLSAERSQADAQSQLLALERQALDARIDLHLALGGGFDVARPTDNLEP